MDDDKLQQFGWILCGACMTTLFVCSIWMDTSFWWMTIPFRSNLDGYFSLVDDDTIS
jgi:hypothetical protein